MPLILILVILLLVFGGGGYWELGSVVNLDDVGVAFVFDLGWRRRFG